MGEEVNLIMEPEDLEMQFEPVQTTEKEETKQKAGRRKKTETVDDGELVNCLRKELVNVVLVKKKIEWITDSNHPLSDGMADGTTATFVVPKLRNGELKNPLTKLEKDFLEDYMGLEPNALSIHKRPQENFWTNRQVIVQKKGTVLDLSTPMGYINYKILLMNTDTICPSLEELKLMPKATYKYVLVSDKEQYTANAEKATTRSKCWKEYLKIESKPNVLKSILESMTGEKVGGDIQLEYLQNRVSDLIESNAREFLSVVTDPLLQYKALLKEAVESNVVELRGDYYYYNNTPMCGKDENPTITVAARYVSNPKNQEILFSIQGRLK